MVLRQPLPATNAKWHSSITANLEKAVVVLLLLLLVSNAALASDYIRNIEVRRALERAAAGLAVVVPAILERCQWTVLPRIKDLQAVPKDAKPLRDWKPRNAGWFDAMERLKTRMEGMRKRFGRDA